MLISWNWPKIFLTIACVHECFYYMCENLPTWSGSKTPMKFNTITAIDLMHSLNKIMHFNKLYLEKAIVLGVS